MTQIHIFPQNKFLKGNVESSSTRLEVSFSKLKYLEFVDWTISIYFMNWKQRCDSLSIILWKTTSHISNLHTFGYIAYVHVSHNNWTKLDLISHKLCMFISYDVPTKSFGCFDIVFRKMIISRHVRFDGTSSKVAPAKKLLIWKFKNHLMASCINKWLIQARHCQLL